MIDTATAPSPVAERRAPRGRGGRLSRAFVLVSAEAVVSVFAALLLTYLGKRLHVNPLSRIGQVSGLAAIQLRLLLLLAVTVLLYLFLSRRWPGAAVNIGAATVAGLATGVTAAANVVALRGTTWPLNGYGGDIGNLQSWAFNVIDGVPLPEEYPPGFPNLLAFVAQVFFDGHVAFAVKWVMIGFLAISGPVAYLAWRMLLPPLWALGIGLTSALPLFELYKPYSPLVLVVVIPVFAKLVQVTQRSALLSRRQALAVGAGLGALLAGLFLMYAGWFVWSAVGVVVLFAIVLTGLARSGGLRALWQGMLPPLAATGVFLLLAGPYMVRLLGVSGSTKDAYFYFDTSTDPAYFAMWGSSLPGPQRAAGLPPLGELGGVGLFAIVLVIGLAVSLALALRQPMVLTLAACTASAFLLRYWYASHMERDDIVQLYPRTSIQITYCLLALTGLAVYYSVQRIRDWSRSHETLPLPRRSGKTPARRSLIVGALCGLGLLYGMAGSATADAYMPKDPAKVPESLGNLTWFSHTLQQPNGKCPAYAPRDECGTFTLPKRPMPQRPTGQP
uniref:Galactan 5-O-arabinofuranosyltransferase n=1 Tax=Streptomyces sp. NBC_00049 TaxID=2903617 RepID=A0AAU2JRS5_9ACTN